MRGDYTKLLQFLDKSPSNRKAFFNSIYLDSKGGDVVEAMKMASLLDKSYSNTFVLTDAVCLSSCVLLWASGVSRTLQGRLGVHRLTLARDEMSVSKTEKIVGPASQSVESYLVRMGIPRRIIDKMNETSAKDLFIIDLPWLVREDLSNAIHYRPTFIDVAEKKCGPSPVVVSMKNQTPPNRDSFMKWMLCVDDVREENQVIELPNIFALVQDGLRKEKGN